MLLLAAVLFALVCVAAFRLPTLTHPKFLKGLSYKDAGWVHEKDGDTQTFIISAPIQNVRRRMDALVAKKLHWLDGGEGEYQWNGDSGLFVYANFAVEDWNASDGRCHLGIWYEREMNLWERLKFWFSDEF